ncbi:DUF4333 domain-containing protein [Actinocorallia populi]|uniref:DUF4333 domain-containing protein n=1 Tax=Actinocorallia populi TaxID=2079200 RepID=UPI001300B375|nr:DUF4333 domain-containing protein [Actinocorallia populi]
MGIRGLLRALLGTGLAAGCSSPGAPSVEKAVLEQEIKDKYTREGLQVLGVSCAGDLSGKAGTAQSCEVTAPHGVVYPVKVTITGVRGGELSYGIRLGGTGRP